MLPETVVDGLAFPECPRWHDGALYFSDMHDGIVWRMDSGGKTTPIVQVPSFPAGLGWLPDGTLQVVSMNDRRVLRLTNQGLVIAAELSPFISNNTNDMVVDRHGRAYVGNFGFDLNRGAPPCPTVLLSVDLNGDTRVEAEDLWFPNGAAITEDGNTLLLAETWGNKITAFDILADGRLVRRRTFAALGELYPDGICLDAESALWVACATSPKIVRVLEGGAITHDIPLPGRNSYACMLGGAERRDLYICTAQEHVPDRTVKLRSGKIEVLRVDVPGAGLP
jgi:sugar lactone lactonase YvrE